MRVFVKAKAHAKRTSVKQTGKDRFEISVQEAPEHGKANGAMIRALAEHLGIAPSRIRLVSGARAKRKVFELRLKSERFCSFRQLSVWNAASS